MRISIGDFVLRLIGRLNGTNSIFNPAYRKQLLATLTVCIISISHGLSSGWPAPTLRKIMSDATPLDFSVSIDQASWIGSLFLIGAIIADVIQSFVVNMVGRKLCIFVMILLQILGWILIYAVKNIAYLYAARILLGFTTAASASILVLFLGDISNKNVRGTFVSMFIVSMTLGTVIGFLLASVLSYFIFPWIAISIPVLFQLLFTFFPESPQLLLKNGGEQAALESFQFYGNYGDDKLKCQNDFNDLKAAITDVEPDKKCNFRQFVTRSALKSYCTATVLLLLMQFSCLYAFITYMSDIFAISGAPIDPDASTIIVGVAQLLGNITAAASVDHWGRKVLLIISGVGVAIALTLFGSYAYLIKLYETTSYNWIPLVCMASIFFLGSIGILSLPVVILVEYLPVKIRANILPICFFLTNVFGFAANKFFPIFMYNLGLGISMWICAGLIAVFLTYIIIFLPETKGRSNVSD